MHQPRRAAGRRGLRAPATVPRSRRATRIDVDAVLLVQRDQPHRHGSPRLPVDAAGRAQDPPSVTAARVGAELERQAPVELLDHVQADRVAQDPVGMTALPAPRRSLDRRPRPKCRKRRNRLDAVAIDPHDARPLDQIIAPPAAAPTRNDADKHICPARPADDLVDDTVDVRDTMNRRRIPPTRDDDLDALLALAIVKYLDPDPQTRRDALEKPWDAFERAKTVPSGKDKKARAPAATP